MYILFGLLALIILLFSQFHQSSVLSFAALIFAALAIEKYEKHRKNVKEKAINEQIRQNSASKNNNSEINEDSNETVPNYLLIERLEPYDEVKKCKCPKCGYWGLVGVDRKKSMSKFERFGLHILIAIPLFILIYKFQIDFFLQTILSFIAIPVIIILGFIVEYFLFRTIYFCPSCCNKFH